MVNGTTARKVGVEGTDDNRIVGKVGLHALALFADRMGLPDAMTDVIHDGLAGERAPLHRRGTVLTHHALMLAGGGEACSDIEELRAEALLFGHVCSDSTLWRAFHELTPQMLVELAPVVAAVRAKVWARSSVTNTTDPVLLDIDATLVEVHSENKEGAAAHYKGGYGFHPMLCFADATGECLSGMLRPGNAGANNAADHLTVLDQAIAQLPADIWLGHRPGDDPGLVRRTVVVRADSAGCTYEFVNGCRARNVGFAVTARRTGPIEAAIAATFGHPKVWTRAIRGDDIAREAWVTELTDTVDLTGWPTGTRLIVRREKRHPGAQTSLFPDDTDWRYWGHLTDQPGDPATLDLTMRQHAHVENHIARLKDSGLIRMPFRDLDANKAWLFMIRVAGDLVRWFQLLCLTGATAHARPKRLRWTFWHTPGVITTHAGRDTIKIPRDWRVHDELVHAHRCINAIT